MDFQIKSFPKRINLNILNFDIISLAKDQQLLLYKRGLGELHEKWVFQIFCKEK